MLEHRWLGQISFEKALELQEALVKERGEWEKREERGPAARVVTCHAAKPPPDVLLLLEHEPVYTMGRTLDQSSLRDANHLPHPVVKINRGGQATYHGPGQLVGYPILDLAARGQDLHHYLRGLEEVLLETLAFYGVKGCQREGLTGVWVGEGRKIASIGIGVRKWISMHGFALNVCGDLSPFTHITPCGITGVEMTSLERETGVLVPVKAVAERVSEVFQKRFGENTQ